MKKMPLRAEEVMEAFTPFPVDCSIILERTIVAMSGRVTACARSRKIVPYFTQKKYPSFTRPYRRAP